MTHGARSHHCSRCPVPRRLRGHAVVGSAPSESSTSDGVGRRGRRPSDCGMDPAPGPDAALHLGTELRGRSRCQEQVAVAGNRHQGSRGRAATHPRTPNRHVDDSLESSGMPPLQLPRPGVSYPTNRDGATAPGRGRGGDETRYRPRLPSASMCGLGELGRSVARRGRIPRSRRTDEAAGLIARRLTPRDPRADPRLSPQRMIGTVPPSALHAAPVT